MVVKYSTVSLRHKHSPETLIIHINQCIHIVLAFTSNARQLIIHFKTFSSTKISFLKISFFFRTFCLILLNFILFDFSKIFFFRKYCSQLTGQRYCSLVLFTVYCSWITVHGLLFMDYYWSQYKNCIATQFAYFTTTLQYNFPTSFPCNTLLYIAIQFPCCLLPYYIAI